MSRSKLRPRRKVVKKLDSNLRFISLAEIRRNRIWSRDNAGSVSNAVVLNLTMRRKCGVPEEIGGK
jgi:hypothetical protein